MDVVTVGGGGAPARVSRFFRRHRKASLFATLGGPVAWMLLVYIGSLVVLVAAAFFKIDSNSKVTTDFTTANVKAAFTTGSFVDAIVRSVLIALAVTAVCFAIALPMAFYIAKVAKPRWRRSLIVAVLLPLWAGYLVKGYAWKSIFTPDAGKFAAHKGGGFLEATLGWTPGFGKLAIVITLAYLWLPYMVLPIYAGLERLPPSYLDAAGDLGARPFRTFRSVIMPILVPSIAAGSIFTFSLSLGDYITPRIISGGKEQMIGNLIDQLQQQNQALSAALTLWPIAIIIVYLLGMSRLHAFESV
ncbi:MAG: transporter permease protein [Ilumatobacteraceae bacterium]|nr:transporter permease protein [Ilumatobacteraceae bacterium]